jgi:hypothetical protein
LSLSELALVAGSAAAGVAVGSVAVYFFTRNKRTAVQENQASLSESSAPSEIEIGRGQQSQKEGSTIPRDQLQKSRKELRTLLLEKELVSAALTRLYEAEAAKQITKEEREILGAKYRDELKLLNDKISKIDALIQIGDLETLRDQLTRLVNQKIDAIDKRIESTRLLVAPILAEMAKQQASEPKLEVKKPGVPDISDLLKEGEQTKTEAPQAAKQLPELESPVVASAPDSTYPQATKRRSGTADTQAEELQKEVLEALDRLAKLDVES